VHGSSAGAGESLPFLAYHRVLTKSDQVAAGTTAAGHTGLLRRWLAPEGYTNYLHIKIVGGADTVIHHVQLACPAGSEPALREFYGGVLGLDELQKPPVLAARGGCWFRGHGIELHLGVEKDFQPARKAHPGLLVEGLDDWARRLRDAGYPVLFDGDFPGMRRFYTQDPNGNRLEFLEEGRSGNV
jgi:catechol 2,3-dioxygenase-like lactoylglutathione lyase family enzyme